MQTPVLLVVFNRPALTRRALDAVRLARPERLLVAADGPRPDHANDASDCRNAREEALRVDWPCRVETLLRTENLGCGRAVAGAIDWAFEGTDRVLVLEDDCLPSQSFFRFVEELLPRYECDERIMSISGNNFLAGRARTDYSYYFSRYPHCWGWATWRRAWQHFDHKMRLWPEVRDGHWLEDILDDDRAARYWHRIFSVAAGSANDTWGYHWTFACWVQSGLTILPTRNLVENVGFGPNATHTQGPARMPSARELSFPLSHPPFVIRDRSADAFTQGHHFDPRLWHRAKRRTARLLRSAFDVTGRK